MNALVQRRANVRVDEILANEKQGHVEFLGQRVGEAVAEVEPRGVTWALTETTVRLPGDVDLLKRHGFDDEVKPRDQSIERRRDQRIRMAIDNDGGFEEGRGGYPP